ncbi:MAG: methylenetetrahydromethanopterin dehydrogenase [Gammaproteobacteria bacterium]|nr:methylenetetrahydromethanopterin dehydrogenase [Gammaproteobacteria bacterium]
MPKRKILHMLSPAANISPFDANMAADAGYEIILPYTGVDSDGVTDLVQDAIFSRPPKNAGNTGVFIGGWDVNEAAEMFRKARKAMVPPFELSVFADPNGAYTTSAAMVARVEHCLKQNDGQGLEGRKVKIFGGGPVGLCAAVLLAQQEAKPTLVRLTKSANKDIVDHFAQRYEVDITSANGQTDELKKEAVQDADVIIASAKAGICVASKAVLDAAPVLKVVADVNAVPPAGIEDVNAMDNGAELTANNGNVAAIGALVIGKIKYDVQQGLFKRMMESGEAQFIDFPQAYEFALQHV